MPRSTPSIREQVHALLKKATGYGNTFEAQCLFARMTGSLQLAVLINQLLYWSERATRSDGAVFKSSADWEEELPVSGYAVRQFNKLPFIETSLHRANNIPTTHYRIHGEMLLEMVRQYLASHAKPAHKAHAQIDESSFSIRQQLPVKSTNAHVETYEPLTSITPDTTPSITASRGKTQKNAPPVDPDKDPEQKEVIKTENRPIQEKDPYITALVEVTGCDPHLRSHAARLARVAKELMQAGYTPSAILDFTTWWQAHDFRWKKDKQLPTPEDVLKQIPRARSYTRNDYAASWAKVATLKNMTGK